MFVYHTESEWIDWVDALADHDYVIIDDFLPEDALTEINTYFLLQREKDEFSRAAIGALDQRQTNDDIRRDYIYWLNDKQDRCLSNTWGLLFESMQVLNRYCFLSLSDLEFHLAYYPTGGYYKRHLDQFQNRNNRLISMVIYLNENWQNGDGGELEIFQHNESILIEPIAGRCAMFRSDIVEHAVRQAFKPRKSLTGWLLHQPAGVAQLAL